MRRKLSEWEAGYERDRVGNMKAVAEVGLLVAVLVLPIAIGAAMHYLGRPWWWGAALAIVLVFVAAIAPQPEEGESRLVAGDLAFLAVVAAIAAGLVWLGFWLTGRVRRSP